MAYIDSSKRLCKYCGGSGMDDHANEPLPGQSAYADCPACRGTGFDPRSPEGLSGNYSGPNPSVSIWEGQIPDVEPPPGLISDIMKVELIVAACNGKGLPITEPSVREIVRRVLLWLTLNPKGCDPSLVSEAWAKRSYDTTIEDFVYKFLVERQKAMFLKPDPYIAIADLLISPDCAQPQHVDTGKEKKFRTHNSCVKEAFERGLRLASR